MIETERFRKTIMSMIRQSSGGVVQLNTETEMPFFSIVWLASVSSAVERED